ncbi:MAG: p-cumate dioxygenase [Nocardioides sp.]|nr:p-cumate dioxygenase [Nocardioides sp.]
MDVVKILVVGTSVAGTRTAQALRSRGFDGELVLLGEEVHLPYDRPPLSKELLAPDASDEAPLLVPRDALDALELRLELGQRATSLDPRSRVVTTDDGSEHPYDRLVVATGADARRLPGTDGLGGVHTLRTWDDARALQQALPAARSVVVVGASFIGAELASAAAARGTSVTLVEMQPVPLAHVLGPEVGGRLAAIHEESGSTLLTGVGVAALEGDAHVTGVVLTDGRRLPADLVVVGVGAVPRTEWLEGSGVVVADGVRCSEDLRAEGVDDVWAAGDVARRTHPLDGVDGRVEHWTNANEHADVVAASITGGPAPPPAPPYVWSDQYGHRIQIVGRPALGALVHVAGTLGGGDLVAAYADPTGVLVGAVVVDDPRALMRCRKAVTRRAAWTDSGLVPATA